MSLYINGDEIKSVGLNNQEVKSIYYNNNLVWQLDSWKGLADASWEEIYNLCKKKQDGQITSWPSDIVIGATKTMIFEQEIYGNTSIDVVIIGLDIDGPGTITFQAKTLFNEFVVCEASSNSNTTLETACDSFYWGNRKLDRFFKRVKKGTCRSYGTESRNATVTYSNASIIWIPSEFEVGLNQYSPLSVENSTATNAESTYGVLTPYPYYSNNVFRTKYHYYDGEWVESYWWLRSKSYHKGLLSSKANCIVEDDGTAGYWDSTGLKAGFAPAFVIG